MAPPGHVDMQHTALSSSSCSHMPVIIGRFPPINIGHLGLDSRLASCPSSLITIPVQHGVRFWIRLFTIHILPRSYEAALLRAPSAYIYLAFIHNTGAREGLGSIFLSCYRYDFALLCMLVACMIPQVTSYSAVLAVVSFLCFGSILPLQP